MHSLLRTLQLCPSTNAISRLPTLRLVQFPVNIATLDFASLSVKLRVDTGYGRPTDFLKTEYEDIFLSFSYEWGQLRSTGWRKLVVRIVRC